MRRHPRTFCFLGRFEVWANGHNICRHVEQGQSIGAVHWYLLPILQWLASNWDFLLHEERLPMRNAVRDAWISMHARRTRRRVYRNMLPNIGRKAGTTGGNVIHC